MASYLTKLYYSLVVKYGIIPNEIISFTVDYNYIIISFNTGVIYGIIPNSELYHSLVVKCIEMAVREY